MRPPSGRPYDYMCSPTLSSTNKCGIDHGGLKGNFSAQIGVFGWNAIDGFLGAQAAGVVLET